MTEKFKKVKALLQRPASPKKFGTDPWEPWSATNQVSENSIKGQRAGTLARYLKSRGINPTFVSKDQRIAHTKSDTYKKWMRDHMFESIDVPEQPETADKNASDAQMSYAKKNKKKLHISKNIETPPGSMVRKTMESVELDEVLTKSTTAGETIDDFVHSKNKMFTGDSKAQRIKRALGAYYKKQNEETETKNKKKKTLNPGGSMPTTTNNKTSYSYNDMTEGWAVNSDIISDEKKDTRTASEKMSDYAVKRHKVYQGIADKQKEHIKKWNDDHKDEPHLQIPVKEDIYQDGQSATQTVFDMGNNTDDTSQRFNRVKNAMKKKHVKEDTYDWEKADKSVATPGKKPKMDKSNEKTGEATTKPKAAAVLSGGTTMTGEPRDMIEIDPSMQGRPGQDGGLPSAKTKR
jgi:hypothetical protein